MEEDEAKLKEIKDREAEQAELHREQRTLG
jgi:hypothetical protein